MDDTKFSHDELIKVLKDAQEQPENPEGVLTGPELTELLNEQLGVSSRSVDKWIDRALASGDLVVGQKKKPNRLNIVTTVRGYKLSNKSGKNLIGD